MPVLDKLVIATIGTLPHELKDIRKWIDKNGGKYSANVKRGVTHLIASKEAWKTAAPSIQQATGMGIPVVSYDWFDDSLQSKRKLSSKKYTWEVIQKERNKKKQLKRLGAMADGKKFRTGCERIRELTGSGTSVKAAVVRKPKKSKSFFFATPAPVISDIPFVSATEDLKRRRAEREAALADGSEAPIENEDEPSTQASPSSSSSAPKPVSPTKKKTTPPSSKKPTTAPANGTQAKKTHWKDLYHYYQDTTGFEYKILLVRVDGSSNGIAQYNLGLLESHLKPHTYWTIVQYKPKVAAPPPAPDDLISSGKIALPFHPSDSSSTAQQKSVYDPAAHEARLRALISKPAPTEDKPYNSHLCPQGSDYATASRAFRHAFRDLTLLSWEERFDTGKTLQKARAQLLNIEPFFYEKPNPGLPMGLLPQEAGMFCGDASGLEVRGDIEDGYIRGKLGLPSISEPLSKSSGFIGGAIAADEREVRKREELRLRRIEEKEEAERRKRGEVLVKEKKINHNRPMFNGPMGRPEIEYGGGGTNGVAASSGRGFVAPEYAHLVKKVRPFFGGKDSWMG
jgi:hypothetical protein